MSLPGFTAEASVYKTTNYYRLGAKGSFLNDGKSTITPQGCGIIEGIVCGTAIAGATVLCTSACTSGPVACALCFSSALGITLFGFCRDCIPFDIGGNGGGGENPPIPCSTIGQACGSGGRFCCSRDPSGVELRCLGGSCVARDCLSSGQICTPGQAPACCNGPCIPRIGGIAICE